MSWFEEERASGPLLRLCAALSSYWYHTGQLGEGIDWLTRAIALGREAGASPFDLSMAISWLGRLMTFAGDYATARSLLEEALAIRRAEGNSEGIAYTQVDLSRLDLAQCRPNEAAERLREATTNFRVLQIDEGHSMALDALSEIAFQRDDHRAASAFANEAVEAARRSGNGLRLSIALIGLAQLRIKQRRISEALEFLAESLRLAQSIDLHFGMADAVTGIAAVAGRAGHYEDAIRLLAVATRIRDDLSSSLLFHETLYRRTLDASRRWVDSGRYLTLTEEGQRLSLEAALDLADVVVARVRSGAVPGETFGLSAREQEVLAILAQGKSNPEIAAALSISRKTVAVHVSNILAKLGVANRSAAAALAAQHGFDKLA
jgi:ATP/maltotriose-dependent transcriptional regulator MalT